MHIVASCQGINNKILNIEMYYSVVNRTKEDRLRVAFIII